MSSSTQVLLVASLALALAYGALSPGWRDAGIAAPLLAALKASGIVLLALIAFQRSRTLMAALLFGALGDVLLALDADTFLFGAVAFLVGHILYIMFFLRNGVGIAGLKREPLRVLAMAAIAAAAIALNATLLPSGHPLFYPLLVYSGVLLIMTLSTFTLPAIAWFAMAGGVLFLVSDGFVAAHIFHADSPIVAGFGFGFIGWMLYWAGQAGLCLGGINAARGLNSRSRGPH